MDPTEQQTRFLHELALRDKECPTVWGRWLTDLWVKDYISTRNGRFFVTDKGRAWLASVETEIDRHELIIVVDASARGIAEATKAETIKALEHAIPGVIFTMISAESDFVDEGRYLVMPCRGSTGGPLKPMPPPSLVRDAERVLERLRFLEVAAPAQ